MTYQVLARKWRPKTFADLVGQQHVVKALQNALANGRLHHAYLLTGTRGVGKTTIARILAKSLNCENAQHGDPCGQCDTCQAIDAGRFVDLLEIDAASNTGIDNIREVLENAQYAPTAGKYKVYIIDEVHMLSKSAFNAMLKTLEEPPEHVKFILATTDPHKVPITVLSRCLQFVLRNMTAQQVSDHLAHVLNAEHIAYDPAALTLLGRAAQGSMRDALSLLDQAIAMGSGSVTQADVRQMIGAVDNRYLFELMEILSQKNGAALIAKASEMHSQSLGFDSVLGELALLLQRIALLQTVPTAIPADDPEYDRLHALARAFNGEQIQLYYQCALHGKQDLPLAPDEYAGFVMTLLRMLAFAPFTAENVPTNAAIENTQMHEPAAHNVGSLKTPAVAAPQNIAQPSQPANNPAPTEPQPLSGSLKTENANEVTTNTIPAPTATTAAQAETPEPPPAISEKPAAKTVAPESPNPSEEPSGSLKTGNTDFGDADNFGDAKTSASRSTQTPAVEAQPSPVIAAEHNVENNKSLANEAAPETPVVAPEQIGSLQAGNANKVETPAAQSSETKDSETPAAEAKPLSGSLKTESANKAETGATNSAETETQSPQNIEPAPPPAPKKSPRKKSSTTTSDADSGSLKPNEVSFGESQSEHISEAQTDATPFPAFAAENWTAIAERISKQISAARMLLDHTAWVAYQDGELRLAIVSEKTKNTTKKEYFDRIANALSEAYQIPVRIQTQPFADGNGWETPAMHRSRLAAENRAHAQALMEQDPALQAIQQHFGATWDSDSIALNAEVA
ncbi:DNA polymerase III subunit gamma/tau [Kingella sp. (in: b-proteobacteria)]|uniref:DNA polymerase III subunit gamma/tau n=1 Tax=Kingella sp. (in: b-proteobacteria) TaxID=2020713 RepID=UPI0026DB3C53|nr:DNA polymerase III subunit gamma/tau [Kingella sp. (in: b-proteobacteria)]MDO4657690.1 DNA polymerase III subunit gamma/tau [Kingella sp. (in: b-proteobacteria)]